MIRLGSDAVILTQKEVNDLSRALFWGAEDGLRASIERYQKLGVLDVVEGVRRASRYFEKED